MTQQDRRKSSPTSPSAVETVTLCGLQLKKEVAAGVKRYAREHDLSLNAAISELLESWSQRALGPRDPRGQA